MLPVAHLRVHTDFSMSEGASKVKQIIARAKELGIPALGIADRDGLYGGWDFSNLGSAAGVQPILGATLHMEVEAGRDGSFILLAQNDIGYINLCRILRMAYDPQPDEETGVMVTPQKPLVDPVRMAEHTEGLIFLTGGGPDGLLPLLIDSSEEEARETFRWLQSIFCDRLYVEICRNLRPEEVEAEKKLFDFAYGGCGPTLCNDGVTRTGAPLVATTDVWYATPDRHDAWVLLKAVGSKNILTEEAEAEASRDKTRYHMRSIEEMNELFADIPEALENTINIARRCSTMAQKRKPILPPFECEGGRSEADELRYQAHEGLKLRLQKEGITGEEAQVYVDRVDYELDVINRMGFPGYFLIVSDFIKWAKANNIPVGPGRGSGAGSAVAWALVITDLNPIRFGLLFERFLNPERVSMPDFDIDFCETRRDEVIQYVQRRYGSQRVSMIATFGVIKAKTALRDAGRALEHGNGEINGLCKTVPDNPADPKTLQEAYEESDEFRQEIDSSQKLQQLFVRAKSIEGMTRQVGIHAAGIIIGDRPLHELFPVTWNADAQMPVCSYDKYGSEYVGAVKFDFLGLKTLTVIQLAVSYVKMFRGVDLDISSIPLDDPKVYARLAEGKTTSIFQLEGGGMRKALRQIKPTRLEDITAVNALYRPGPMDNIPEYAERKHGKSWESPHPDIHPVLAETHGIMIYQEQVMEIAQRMAGYSLGGADLLRRAMGKKIRSEMDKQRSIFIEGSTSRGVSSETATAVFDLMAKFADYGFNKSHAAAYALIAYQTAWLKCHYPAEFLSAAMTFETSGDDAPKKLAMIKEELDELGIPLLPPDVNRSYAQFRPEPHDEAAGGLAVRFGMMAIKGISGTQEDFLAEREAKGPYKGITEFYERVGKCFNKSQVESLAGVGAFRGICDTRRQAAHVFAWLSSRKKKEKANQDDLFGGSMPIMVPPAEMQVKEWGDVIEREFNAVGFYFSDHPIDPYMARLMKGNVRRKKSFASYMFSTQSESLENAFICVMVDDIRSLTSKRGNSYLRFTVSEKEDSFMVSCFANRKLGLTIEHFRRVAEGARGVRRPVVFEISMSQDNSGEDVWVNARNIWTVDEFLQYVGRDIDITIDTSRLRPVRVEDREAQKLATTPEAEQEMARKLLDIEIAAISESLQPHRRSQDNDPVGCCINIIHDFGVTRLPGTYNISKETEALVQQRRSVTSVTETEKPFRSAA